MIAASATDDVYQLGRFSIRAILRPASYASAAQLLQRAAAGDQVVLAVERADGGLAGYSAGRVQPDGEGYPDFVAVDPAARGGGAGRRLVFRLVRLLLPATITGQVHLTVQEHRAPARALDESPGFRIDASFGATARSRGLTGGVSPPTAAGPVPTGGSCR